MNQFRHPTNPTGPRARRSAGFTLIELLVVLAVIGVVAAIFLPVLASARERSRRTACLSNLRQIAVGFQQYVQDDGGVYPLNVTREGDWWAQAVSPYLKNNQVLLCPDLPPDAPLNSIGSKGESTGYGYDWTRLNVFAPPYPTKNVRGTDEAALATPATTWLLMDEGWISEDGEYHYIRDVPRTSCGRWFVGGTLRSGGGDYSFVDGHVKWLTPEAAGEVDCGNGPMPAPFKD